MSIQSEKLAQSLAALRSLQKNGTMAIRSQELSRIHRERLCRNGFLEEIMKGWYIPARPGEPSGKSTAWYASFWPFCASYLTERFGKEWILSAEQSISLLVGNRTVPKQLIVRAKKGKNNITPLPQHTSLLDIKSSLPAPQQRGERDGLNLYTLSAALVTCSSAYFRQNPIDVRAALLQFNDASEILELLLSSGHTTTAGYLAGAFDNVGKNRVAQEIIHTMLAAGFNVRKHDPFASPSPPLLINRSISPYVSRLKLMWQTMRQPILDSLPTHSASAKNSKAYLNQLEDIYITDAYHSLSIEGYKVSEELIKRVRGGRWNPETNISDSKYIDALAARGYWQAYQSVKQSLKRIFAGENAGSVVSDEHLIWYRNLFSPSITAGLLRPSDIAGYRREQVFIQRSMHVPPNKEAVRDLMPIFFELLQEETNASARVILGHFVFVYIHPYMDGNGRIARFLMNCMLAAAGYPWTIIPVEEREQYLKTLEIASTKQNIEPFAKFISQLVRRQS